MNIEAARQAARTEACKLIRNAGKAVFPHEKITGRIARLAVEWEWHPRRVAAIWWHEAHDIRSFEMDWLRRVARKRR